MPLTPEQLQQLASETAAKCFDRPIETAAPGESASDFIVRMAKKQMEHVEACILDALRRAGGEWIPVAPAMPRMTAIIHAIGPMGQSIVGEASFHHGFWFWQSGSTVMNKVTHYMPMPAPPAERE